MFLLWYRGLEASTLARVNSSLCLFFIHAVHVTDNNFTNNNTATRRATTTAAIPPTGKGNTSERQNGRLTIGSYIGQSGDGFIEWWN